MSIILEEKSLRICIETSISNLVNKFLNHRNKIIIHNNTHRVLYTEMSRKGFTLAEVLISMAVIGVVASMTIPALMQSVSDKQHKVIFKKTYSEIAQATKMLRADNNGSLVGVFANYNDFRDEYMPYLKYAKSGGTTTCGHEAGTVHYLSGSVTSSGITGPCLILNSGAFLIFRYGDSSCTDCHGTLCKLCGHITIDVNGYKKPNAHGKDIFKIYISKENDILPAGAPGDNGDCLGTGYNCAIYVLKNIDY